MVNTLVCVSHLRWDFVWQRPQHLLGRLSQQYRVIFVEEPVCTTELVEPRLEILAAQNAPNVKVVRLVQPVQEIRWIGHGDPLTQATYDRLLHAYLEIEQVNDPLLWFYTPMARDFVDSIDHKLLIFDVMDQLSAFKGAPQELVQYETNLLATADLVFTGGISLYRDKLPFNRNVYLFPSGVEIDHFGAASNSEAFERPADLVQTEAPILGYFGVIDERMDLALLSYVANAHPDWEIVLIGPVVKIDQATLPQSANLHYLGGKRYDELPAYLAYFDVALLPFALNESTRYISPTKTLEYMAAHKPIVSTPIHDVIELYGDVVQIGYTPAQFVQSVEEALSDANLPEAHRMQQETILTLNTWDSIAQRMNELIEDRIAAKLQIGEKA